MFNLFIGVLLSWFFFCTWHDGIWQETLFDGYPGVEQLRRKLEKLLGIECDGSKDGEKDTPRNPPWICVCLKSFYVQKADIWGSRNFRIFDTKIVGDAW